MIIKDKKINITAGEILNEYLLKREKGLFIPFNEICQKEF
jgi:hypothetical protein